MPAGHPAGHRGSPEDLLRVLRAEGIRDRDLAARAQADLAAVGLDQARVVVGDGTLGVPEHAPYQAIVVAAASPRIPPRSQEVRDQR